jgi:hypothetical protein
MFNNAIIDKEYRKTNVLVILGMIFFLLTAFFLGYALIDTAKEKNRSAHLNDIMWADEDREDRIAYADLAGFYQFAVYGDDLGYYIAYDDDFFYIISMKDKDFDVIAKQFDEEEYVRVWGYTRQIPQEPKSFAISSLQEDYPEENITMSDFEDIFGDLMLEVKKTSYVRGLGSLFRLNGTLVACGVTTLIAGLIMFLLGLSQRKSFNIFKNTETGSNPLTDEMNALETEWFSNDSLCLTENYLINVKGTVSAVRYEDIFWAYVTKHSTNGIQDYDYLNVITNDGRQIVCGNSRTFGKKNRASTQELHESILNKLLQKNPNIRIGYDQDNLTAMNELKKKLKQRS